MTVERLEQTNATLNISTPERARARLRDELIESIVNETFRTSGGCSFETIYKAAGLEPEIFLQKFDVASQLAEDGRYKNYQLLLDDFVAKDSPLNPPARELRGQLRITLLEKGLITPAANSEDETEAQDALISAIDRNELLRRLREDLPSDAIHVMGAISTVLLFENVSVPKKQEELRSWTTRALIRPYLGDLLTRKPKAELNLNEWLTLVPDKVYEQPNKVIADIVKSYLIKLAIKEFDKNEEEGLKELERTAQQAPSETIRVFLREVYRELSQVVGIKIPPKFVSQVENVFSEPVPFPHFRQKYFLHEFLKTGRKLLNGDTGAGKTASGYLAMEAAGANRVTIFGPAKARNTWPREAQRLFLEGEKPDVFTVRVFKDLFNPQIETANYIFVSTELLGRAWKNPALSNLVANALIGRRKTDGVILDEADDFRNIDAARSQMLIDLMGKINSQNSLGELNYKMPILALTATPIASCLENLDVVMSILYPERFALPDKPELNKYPFSTQALNNPNIAFSVLSGEKLMVQWTIQDMFKDRVQRLEFGPEIRKMIKITPYENIIYEWIAEQQVGILAKIRLLRSTLINPELIKRACEEREIIPKPVYDKEGLSKRLQELHEVWVHWMLEKDSSIPDESFSADWIAKYGDRDFLIQCFFDRELPHGVDSLVLSFPGIVNDWRARETISSKYLFLQNFLRERFSRDGDSYKAREKVFIVSPYHKRGITRWLEDSNLKDEDFLDNTFSLYEYLLSEWLPGLPQGMAINIDGGKSFTTRDREASIWREDGMKNLIVVASMDSVYESMNWAVGDTKNNQEIRGVSVVYLGWPWGWDEFKQMSGRFLRPGQAKPVDIYVCEAENSIDQGFFELVLRKHLLTQIALAGIRLSKEEQDFFESTNTAGRIVLAQPSVGQVFLRNAMTKVVGRGEEIVHSEFSRQVSGKTFFKVWAEAYFDTGKDEFRLAGHNAELVKNVVLTDKPKKVLSIGAGTCLLARKVVRVEKECEIDNFDINRVALAQAEENFPELRAQCSFIAGRASKMDGIEPQKYDAVDCSFMLHWTQLYKEGTIDSERNNIERVKVLCELNRVLKVGGTAVLSFPESVLDGATFERFIKALTSNFGFSCIDPSGISYAVDTEPHKRIGWIFTLRKVGEPNLSGLEASDLEFLTDKDTKVNYYKGNGKNGNPVVVRTEYPIFFYKQFVVRNPLTRESTRSDSSAPIVENFSPAELVQQIKVEITTDDQRSTWTSARRRIEKECNRNYREAEEILAGIVFRRKLNSLPEWGGETGKKIINSEISKLVRGLEGGI